MRTLELTANASARAWGCAHGESFRGEIQSLAAIRLYLTTRLGAFPDADTVLRVADAHLPVLAAYDRDLYEELCGIAEGADLSPAHIVVVNHYTDLRDIDPYTLDAQTPGAQTIASQSADNTASAVPDRHASTPDRDRDSGGCSILWTETPTGTLLAQTWDMHATAIPYVMMMRVPAHGENPETWLFTLTGCLGMTGLNRHGVGIAINNLHSTDARVGILWPALVRRALNERNAVAARDLILQSPIGAGHHYLVADSQSAYGIETSGTLREVLFARDHPVGDGASYIHTNHCLAATVAAKSRVPQASTTHDRYRRLQESVQAEPVRDIDDAWRRLGSRDGYPRSVCVNMSTPENPHGAATCGAVAMSLTSLRIWGQGGFIHNVAPIEFTFAEDK